MRRTLWFLVCAFLISNTAHASLYERLRKSFTGVASLPTPAQIEGYWGGHCVHWNQPDTIYPSFYIYRSRPTPSQVYYVDHGLDSHRYLNYTPRRINSDPALEGWRRIVEWSPIEIRNDAFANYFSFPRFPRLMREAKFIERPERNWVVLRISAPDYPNTLPYTLCYYSNFLGKEGSHNPNPFPHPTPVPTPEPSPSPTPSPAPSPTPSPAPQPAGEQFEFGQSGELQNQRTTIVNLNAQEEINHLRFKHSGNSSVTLRKIQLQTEGASLGFNDPITLAPNSEKEVEIGIRTKVTSMSFVVSGETSNIRITGIRTRLITFEP